MKKLPLILSLMILSSFVFVNVVSAEDAATAGNTEVKALQEVKTTNEIKAVEIKKIEEAKRMNNERVLEEAKKAKEIKQREMEKVAEKAKLQKEELKQKLEQTKAVENKLIEKKKEIKTNLQEVKTELKDGKNGLEGSDSGEVREPRGIREASDSSREHMNKVADDVNELLQMKEDVKGIGQRVKQVAEEQIKSQEKIAEKLAKMEEKKIWLKKMLGYDKEAVLSVQEEIDANRLRIQELQKLQEETTDKTEVSSLENAANSLIEQNASLQDTVQTEMQNQGVWGWFRSFFKNN